MLTVRNSVIVYQGWARDVKARDRDETETRRWCVSRPPRDRDVETETTPLWFISRHFFDICTPHLTTRQYYKSVVHGWRAQSVMRDAAGERWRWGDKQTLWGSRCQKVTASGDGTPWFAVERRSESQLHCHLSRTSDLEKSCLKTHLPPVGQGII